MYSYRYYSSRGLVAFTLFNPPYHRPYKKAVTRPHRVCNSKSPMTSRGFSMPPVHILKNSPQGLHSKTRWPLIVYWIDPIDGCQLSNKIYSNPSLYENTKIPNIIEKFYSSMLGRQIPHEIDGRRFYVTLNQSGKKTAALLLALSVSFFMCLPRKNLDVVWPSEV